VELIIGAYLAVLLAQTLLQLQVVQAAAVVVVVPLELLVLALVMAETVFQAAVVVLLKQLLHQELKLVVTVAMV